MGHMAVQIDQIGQSTSRGTARSHQILIDRPVAKGGEDRGPLGGEYLVLALGGCFMSNLLAAARARDIVVSGLSIQATATIEESPDRITAITLRISGHNDRAQLQKLVTVAERACIVTNTLRHAVAISIGLE